MERIDCKRIYHGFFPKNYIHIIVEFDAYFNLELH